MLRLHTLTKVRIAYVRVALDLSALIVGFFLGGTVGLGTLIFAFGVGPAVELNLRLTRDYLFWLVPAQTQPASPVVPPKASVPVSLD